MTDDIQYATAALRAGVSLLEGFGVTQGARIGMMREAIERLSMPMIEMQDDFLIKIETGETISWGEFKERQNVKAIGAGREKALHPHAQPFERYPELASHIERMAMSGVIGSLISWEAFLRELNAALSPAPPARTPMGEGAKPAAWMYSHDGMNHDDECPETLTRKRWPSCKEPWTEEALYTHPAPTPMGGDREHSSRCWGKTSFSDEVLHCYCQTAPTPMGGEV